MYLVNFTIIAPVRPPVGNNLTRSDTLVAQLGHIESDVQLKSPSYLYSTVNKHRELSAVAGYAHPE